MTSTLLDSASRPAPTGRRTHLALFALAIGAFAIGTTEFATMGLLPQIAAGVDIDIPTAGRLISAYALGVVVGAPLIVALAARVPRKQLLLALMAVFALGNLASALTAAYPTLLLARFVAGVPHGAYFGVASVVAASLVSADRRARAVSLVMVGLTVSNIAGVPAATRLGQVLGWESLYVGVTAIALLCLVATFFWVPPIRIGDGTASVRSELSALARPQVWFTLVAGMVGFGGMFATYSYIAPTVTTLGGLTDTGVVWILATYGVGMTIGVMLGGRLADRALMPTLYIGLLGLAVMLALFGFLVTTPVGAFVGVFVFGIAGTVLMPALQTRLMDVARDGQSLAAALNHSVLNIGNALGAWLGGIVLAAGLSYAWPSRVAVVLPLLGLAVLAAGRWVERRSARSS